MEGKPATFMNFFRIYAGDFWADTGVNTPVCESSIG